MGYAAVGTGLAATPWFVNLEVWLRIGVDVLTIVAVLLSIYSWWKSRGKN
jgi:predicted signal transduction protein with EAL and GGDEF domain